MSTDRSHGAPSPRRTVTSLAVAGVLLPICGMPSTQASAQESWLPDISDSSILTTTEIAHGRAMLTSGRAFPPGSHVVFALPKEETLASLEIGDSFSPIPVAKALVAEDGSYELKLPATASLQPFLSKGGTVDFDIRVFSDTEFAQAGFSWTLSDSWVVPGDAKDTAKSISGNSTVATHLAGLC